MYQTLARLPADCRTRFRGASDKVCGGIELRRFREVWKKWESPAALSDPQRAGKPAAPRHGGYGENQTAKRLGPTAATGELSGADSPARFFASVPWSTGGHSPEREAEARFLDF